MRLIKVGVILGLSMSAFLLTGSSAYADSENSLIELKYHSVEYDSYLENYRFYAKYNDNYIISSVPDGIITTDNVVLNMVGKVNGDLYKDGDVIEYKMGDEIKDAGKYYYRTNEGMGEDNAVYFSFEIVNYRVSGMTKYVLPEYYEVSEATYNDKNVKLGSDLESFSFDKDGKYRVTYYSDKTNIKETLVIEIDNTAPTIKLSEVHDGKAKSAVDISDAEEDATIYATLDGMEYVLGSNRKLEKQGTYHLEITDTAGNTSKYDFKILFYFNLYSILVIVAVVIGIAAFVFYVKQTRSSIRVR